MIRWKKHKIGYWILKKCQSDELCDAKAGIIEMFNNEFTVEKFAKNYINIISEIAASIR